MEVEISKDDNDYGHRNYSSNKKEHFLKPEDLDFDPLILQNLMYTLIQNLTTYFSTLF